MNVAITDITGQTFGILTAVRLTLSYSGKSRWVCRCKCGAERICGGGDLRAGRVKACYACARRGMAERMKAKAAKGGNLPIADVDRLLGMLDERGRGLYERWERSCQRLSVHVSKNERLEVLREIACGRRA